MKNPFKLFENLLTGMWQFEDAFVLALRISLGLIFFWFGVLKIFGYNPVYDIIYASFPIFTTEIGLVVLGVIETAIGAGLLFNIFPLLTHASLVLHLVGTLSVFVLGPEVMFAPFFPILTLAGEFVFKNIALATAGLVILGYNRKRAQ